jgi:hypothetical protein
MINIAAGNAFVEEIDVAKVDSMTHEGAIVLHRNVRRYNIVLHPIFFCYVTSFLPFFSLPFAVPLMPRLFSPKLDSLTTPHNMFSAHI